MFNFFRKKEKAPVHEKTQEERTQELQNAYAQLIENGRKAGFVSEQGIPTIPELSVQGTEAAAHLLNDLMVDFRTSGGDLKTLPAVYGGWCAYAGMAAAYLWQQNKDALAGVGLYNAIIGPRGIFALDAYALELAGIEKDSEESKELKAHFKEANKEIGSLIASDEGENPMNNMVMIGTALFNYGIAVAMKKLGLVMLPRPQQ